MTEREAIDFLNTDDFESAGFAEATGMAISALEKQIPKKPKITIHNGFCGSCGYAWGHDRLSTEEMCGYKYFQYCPVCGQRIDWEGDTDDSK